MKKTAGMSLMLLIFLSLCLITFSLLSLSGATADSKLSQKSAERTTEYYTAVTAANKVLSEIDTQLAACLKEAEASEDPEQAYLDACAQITVEGVGLTWTIDEAEADSENSAGDSILDDDFADSKDDTASYVSSTDSKDDTASYDSFADSKDDTASYVSSVDSENDQISGTLSFDIDITDTQYLHMELAITWPETGTDTLYRITSQKVVSTQEWSADTSQNLYRISEDETE